MDLTVIGTYGPFPPEGGACSCYLLTLGNDRHIVLDMGPGTLSRLQRYVPLSKIDAVIFSHLHYDHISDAFVLKYALDFLKKQGGVSAKIPLFLPKTPEHIADGIVDPALFDISYMTDGAEVSLYGASFRFVRMRHPVEAYAICVTQSGKKFVYTGDTAYHAGLLPIADGADLLLIEAGLLEQDLTDAPAHLTVAQACTLGKRAKHTVLTHKMPLYTKEALEKEAQGHAEFSEYGKRYNI